MNEKTIKTGETLGLIGFILALVTIPLSFIPCIGVFVFLFAIAAIGLSIASIAISKKHNSGQKLTLPVIGLIVGILAIALKIILISVIFAATTSELNEFGNAMKEAMDTLSY